MRVKVARYSDNNPADLIVEPLLTTEPALTERGRNELDEHQFSRTMYSFNMTFSDDIIPGDMIEVSDSELQETWRGKVISVSITLGKKISTALRVERIINNVT